MFKKAYEGGYAIGAFNVNNMEIVQGITEAAKKLQAPVILQVSAGARKYANHTYLVQAGGGRSEREPPICPSPCIWITATALRSARTASTAASPPL